MHWSEFTSVNDRSEFVILVSYKKEMKRLAGRRRAIGETFVEKNTGYWGASWRDAWIEHRQLEFGLRLTFQAQTAQNPAVQHWLQLPRPSMKLGFVTGSKNREGREGQTSACPLTHDRVHFGTHNTIPADDFNDCSLLSVIPSPFPLFSGLSNSARAAKPFG
jgi:hypothetical protein